MLKHRDMLEKINTGDLFDCTYCKKNGEFTEFKNVKKYMSETGAPAPKTITVRDKRSTRNTSGYSSLLPFVMESGEIRELYTRAIVKFNNEEIIL